MTQMTPPRVVILGAGGHGRVVADLLALTRSAVPIGFLDADPSRIGAVVAGLPVIGTDAFLPEARGQGIDGVVMGVGSAGSTRRRRDLRRVVETVGLPLIGAIHPSAIISSSAVLGPGVVVCAGAVVGLEVAIGANVIVNTGAVVDHDGVIGDDVHIATGAVLAGSVVLEEGVHIGAGAVLRQGVVVGADTVVGAGGVVVSDLPGGVVATGVPARPRL